MRNTVLASFVLLLAVAHTGCHSDDVLPPAQAAWLNVREFGALGTGTVDDGPAIQRALDKASESGGTVYLPLGIYLVDDALYVHGADVVVRGNGGGSLIQASPYLAKKGPNGVIVVGLEADHVDAPSNDVTIRDLAVDGRHFTRCIYGANTESLLITAVLARRSFSAVIGVYRSEHVTVANCIVSESTGTMGDGIYFGGVAHPRALNNTIYDVTRIGIVTEKDGAVVSKDAEIGGNTISRAHDSLDEQSNCGIWLENTNGGVVTGNRCSDLHDNPYYTTKSVGIAVAGGSTEECTFTLIGNDIADARWGCRITASEFATVLIDGLTVQDLGPRLGNYSAGVFVESGKAIEITGLVCGENRFDGYEEGAVVISLCAEKEKQCHGLGKITVKDSYSYAQHTNGSADFSTYCFMGHSEPEVVLIGLSGWTIDREAGCEYCGSCGSP